MKKSIIQLFSFIFVSFFLINAASAGIIIDSPNDVIYSGTFNGTNIFADLIDTSSLIVHSNIAVSGTVDGRDVSIDGTVLDSHTTNVSNPHSLTKEQIGLSNVTDDAQLTVSQLDAVLTDDITKVASSGAVMDYVDTTESNIIIYVNTVAVPTGLLSPFAGSTAPTGYLMCDGSAVSRTEYADLFAVIGTSYGSGDGSTTFNVPDMQGNVAVGVGGSSVTTLGQTGGEETHTLTVTEMPAHSHSYTGDNYGDNAYSPYTNPLMASNADVSRTVGSTGGNGAHNNMQPYVATNYIIKY